MLQNTTQWLLIEQKSAISQNSNSVKKWDKFLEVSQIYKTESWLISFEQMANILQLNYILNDMNYETQSCYTSYPIDFHFFGQSMTDEQK